MRSVSGTNDQKQQGRSSKQPAAGRSRPQRAMSWPDRGYPPASLSAIAISGSAKESSPTTSDGKAEVLREVVDSVLAEAERGTTPELPTSTSYAEALDRYLRSDLAFIAAHRRDLLAMGEC